MTWSDIWTSFWADALRVFLTLIYRKISIRFLPESPPDSYPDGLGRISSGCEELGVVGIEVDADVETEEDSHAGRETD